MKPLKFSVIFFLLAFLFNNSYSQTADDIINQHIAAVGGLENINSINTIKMTGKMNMMSIEIPFTQTVKRAAGTFMEMTLQGMEIKQGYDGTTAWSVNPMMGSKDPKVMEGEDAKQIKEQSDLEGKLVNYSAKGSTVELVGKENVENTETYNVKLTDKENNVTFFYIDAESYLIVKETKTRRMGDNTITTDTYLGDYKTVEGHLFPHTIKVQTSAGPMSNINIALEKIEVNIPVDDNIFKMPEKSK